jgi:SAM-dependent methyltransferase
MPATLHLGCGTGYYTAVVAELVWPTGKVTAIEIDAGLAEKARAALKTWPQITVSNADGATLSFEPADLIVASAGATHPLSSWLVDGIALGIAGRHRSHVPANCGLQPTRLVDWTIGPVLSNDQSWPKGDRQLSGGKLDKLPSIQGRRSAVPRPLSANFTAIQLSLGAPVGGYLSEDT